MTIDELMNQTKDKMTKTRDYYQKDMLTLRAGRANPQILDKIMGLNPSNDGKIIRLVVPELNEERRKELTKVVRKSAEEAKVAVRNTRRDAVETVRKLKKNSEITEDDQTKAEKDLQKMTDNFIKEVDKIAADKEKEIMEV